MERVDHRSLKAQGIDGNRRSIWRSRVDGTAQLRSLRGDENRRRRENQTEKELAALKKIESGLAASREWHALRKQRAAETEEQKHQMRRGRLGDNSRNREP